MSIENELEERLTSLELRYSFQERTIEQLNAEIIRQQGQINELTRRIKEVANEFPAGVAGNEIETPPHY